MDFEETFHRLTEAERKALLERSVLRQYDANAIVIEQAQTHRGIYLVQKGEVRIERRLRVMARYVGDRAGERPPVEKLIRVEIARLGEGSIFGEMSFVDSALTSARVIANGAVDALYIDGTALDGMMEADPGFAARFYHSLATVLVKRLRVTNKRLSAKVGRVAAGT